MITLVSGTYLNIKSLYTRHLYEYLNLCIRRQVVFYIERLKKRIQVLMLTSVALNPLILMIHLFANACY